MFVEYPKWMFSAEGPRLVQDAAECAALGPGWYESPADVQAAALTASEPGAEPVKPKRGRPRKSE